MSHLGINLDILILQEDKLLLGLLSEKWLYEGKKVYGVPGKDLLPGETFEECVRRNIREEFSCECGDVKIICVNANRAFGNHYIGIGAVTSFIGQPQLKKTDDWDAWEWHQLDAIPENLFPAAEYAIECYKTERICISS